MACIHLDANRQCNAGKYVYIPSEFQSDEYCRSAEHKRCPFFVRRVLMDDLSRSGSTEGLIRKSLEQAVRVKKAY